MNPLNLIYSWNMRFAKRKRKEGTIFEFGDEFVLGFGFDLGFFLV